MASFRSNIAPKRVNPITDRVAPAPAPAVDSKQVLSVGQSAKFRTVSTAPAAKLNIGNQVKQQTNTKGTGVAGRPSSIGVVSKDSTAPATENPSGSGNQTTVKYL